MSFQKKEHWFTWLTTMRLLHFCGRACRCFISRAVWHRCTVASSSILKRLQFSGNGCRVLLLGRRGAEGGQFVACLTSEKRLDGERWLKWLLYLQLCLELSLVSLWITQRCCGPGMTATLVIAQLTVCIVRLHFNFSNCARQVFPQSDDRTVLRNFFISYLE